MAEDQKMIKSVAYVRVSGASQVNGEGPESQQAAIRHYAAANGVVIEAWYEDLAVSGSQQFAGRAEFMKAIAHCRLGGIDSIVVARTDRLLRDADLLVTIATEATAYGVQIIDASDGQALCLDNNEPTLKLITRMKAAVAEYSKNELVVRLRLCRQGKAKRLKVRSLEGRKRYGARPGEKELADEIARLNAANYTQTAIAQTLNQQGLRTRYGREWSRERVQSVLAALKKKLKNPVDTS